jgi:carbonic anhydrase
MSRQLLTGNKQFRQSVFGPQGLERLRNGQTPHTCWIGCSDSRVPAGLITNTGAGELFVYRNVANMVPPDDPAVGAALEYAVGHLHVKHIALCGHYGCGGIKALWQGPEKGTMVARWLEHGAPALRRLNKREGIAAATEEKALKWLVEENLRVQREHLLRYPFVKRALKDGKITVDVLVYDVATGKLIKMKE